jgi:hypothetical protein
MGVRPIPKSLMLCVTTGTHCSYTQEHTEIASYTVARFCLVDLPFTRACLNFFTLTFKALGRNHIASTPTLAIAMLCFN